MKLLLENGADVNMKGGPFRSAMGVAGVTTHVKATAWMSILIEISRSID